MERTKRENNKRLMKYTIEVPPVAITSRRGEKRRVPHSPNMILKMHWGNKKRWKDAWQESVYWALKEAGVPLLKNPKITFKLYSYKTMDRDNAFGSIKPLLDGITNAGVIEDDSNKHCTVEVEQIKVNKINEGKVIIEIEI